MTAFLLISFSLFKLSRAFLLFVFQWLQVFLDAFIVFGASLVMWHLRFLWLLSLVEKIVAFAMHDRYYISGFADWSTFNYCLIAITLGGNFLYNFGRKYLKNFIYIFFSNQLSWRWRNSWQKKKIKINE